MLESLHGWREDFIVALDGVLTVAQLVGETDLPGLTMAALAAVEIGDPDRRLVFAHDRPDYRLGPVVADHVDREIVVLEHPFLGVLAFDPRASLVRADDPALVQ